MSYPDRSRDTIKKHGEALTPYALSQNAKKVFAIYLQRAKKRLNALSIDHNINIILFLLKQKKILG